MTRLAAAFAMSCFGLAAVVARGQDADLGALLQRLAPEGTQPVHAFSDVSPLWPCAEADEFEMRRCQVARPERVQALRQGTLVGLSFGRLGEYDFALNAFPVDVARVVVVPGAPSGFSPLLMGRPTPRLLNEFNARSRGLPSSWRLARLLIPFSSPEEAETWRNGRARPDTDGDRAISAVVAFRIGSTWEYREPSTPLQRQMFSQLSRAFGLPNVRPATQIMRGADFRPLGVVLIPPGRPTSSHVVDPRAADDVARLRARVESALSPPAPRPLTAADIDPVVQAGAPQLRACYLQAVSEASDDAVRLDVTLVVAQDGGAVSATVVAVPSLPAVSACVESTVLAWHFPASSAGGTARFPVTFRRSDPGPAPAPRTFLVEPLTAPAVQHVVRNNRDGLRTCYAREMEVRYQPASVRVTVNVQIGRSGTVINVSALGENITPELVACIQDDIRTWVFPPSLDGGNTRFPVVFSDESPDATAPLPAEVGPQDVGRKNG